MWPWWDKQSIFEINVTRDGDLLYAVENINGAASVGIGRTHVFFGTLDDFNEFFFEIPRSLKAVFDLNVVGDG